MELKSNNNTNKRPLLNLDSSKKYIYIIMIFLIILSGFILVNNLSNTKEDSFLDSESKGKLLTLISHYNYRF